MPNYAVMRIQKYNNKNKVQGVLNHMNRKFNIPSLQNAEKKNIYFKIGDRESPITNFHKFFDTRVHKDCFIRKNSVLAIEVIMTFSPEALESPTFNLDEFIKCSYDWCCESFGGEANVCSVVLHNDETTPHLHALIVPVAEKNGRTSLSARQFIDGPASLRALQTSYADSVAQLGLIRGVDKNKTKKRHEDHRRYNAMQEIEATVEKFFEF